MKVGDAEATGGILAGAGFDAIRFQDVRERVLYGHDLDAALPVAVPGSRGDAVGVGSSAWSRTEARGAAPNWCGLQRVVAQTFDAHRIQSARHSRGAAHRRPTRVIAKQSIRRET